MQWFYVLQRVINILKMLVEIVQAIQSLIPHFKSKGCKKNSYLICGVHENKQIQTTKVSKNFYAYANKQISFI